MGKKTSGKGVDKELRDSAQKIWLAGLGALAVAEEEGSKMFNRLVDRGRDWEERGKERAQEGVKTAKARVEQAFEDVEGKVDQRVTETMKRLGVPGRDEIRDLTHKVEELNAKLEALQGKPTAKPKPEAKPKPKGKQTPKA